MMRLSMPKKLALTALCVTLVLLLSHYAFAAKNDDEIKVKHVILANDALTVRVNQERTLYVEISPRDADDQTVYWTTSNLEVVMVDGDGIITGVSPGTAVITATSHNVLSASCTVTVPGTAVKGLTPDTGNADNPVAQVSGGDRLYAATLKVDVENELSSTPKNESASVSYNNKKIVSTAGLRSAAYTAALENRSVTLRFRTLNDSGSVMGQITVAPALAGDGDQDIQVGLSTSSEQAKAAQTAANQNFGGKALAVQLDHQGSFGLDVQVAVRSSFTAEEAANLTLYQYNGTNYTLLPNQEVRQDANGFLHFTTNTGGSIVAVTTA